MSKHATHLLSEAPMLVYPTLAKLLGINKSIMLQQLHFLLNTTKTAKNKYNFIDGRWWVYNSYPEWQRDYFVWLGESTIKRFFLELEDAGIVRSRQGVKNPNDRRKWYTIDYEAWERYAAALPSETDASPVAEDGSESDDASAQNEPMGDQLKMSRSSAQNEPVISSKRADDLSETSSEMTSETTAEKKQQQPPPADKDASTPFVVWEQEMQGITPMIADTLKDWVREYGAAWVVDAIREAKLSGGNTPKYVYRILDRWRREGKGGRAKGGAGKDEQDGSRFVSGKFAAFIEH